MQLDINLHGPLGKADLEQQCERLPAIAGATYSARVAVEIDDSAATKDGGE